ncbi:unnamed protein product [Brassicogethes aeneus]|uniref:Succinate dehydrogenase assembly factor 2, mitochondrial n=1 Tax=Brassicogethes aeneus TaxID=1431903 RepID=A0A9P0FND9_BRAAE|nr:unnamed protein product [Brassicogethes aeneus]
MFRNLPKRLLARKSVLRTFRCVKFGTNDAVDPPEDFIVNPKKDRQNEPFEQKKKRLLYQSSKRGMLENDLIIGSFAKKYLDTFTEEEVDEYDKLINIPSNEWVLYYWASGLKPVPKEFDGKIMKLLKEHCKNTGQEIKRKTALGTIGLI